MFQTTNQVHIPLISPVKITLIPYDSLHGEKRHVTVRAKTS